MPGKLHDLSMPGSPAKIVQADETDAFNAKVEAMNAMDRDVFQERESGSTA